MSFEDLYGMTLAIVNGENNKTIAKIRNFLMQYHPQIVIKDIPHLFDTDVFNHCEESNAVMFYVYFSSSTYIVQAILYKFNY